MKLLSSLPAYMGHAQPSSSLCSPGRLRRAVNVNLEMPGRVAFLSLHRHLRAQWVCEESMYAENCPCVLCMPSLKETAFFPGFLGSIESEDGWSIDSDRTGSIPPQK